MLPVGALTGDDLRISITLAGQNDLITQVDTTVWEVSELEFFINTLLSLPKLLVQSSH